MKAAVVLAPGTLRVMEVPDPVPGDYDALCDVLLGTTCTGTDHHIVNGTFPWPISYPTILGHESVGRVIACGPKVRNLRVGDLVTRVGLPRQDDLSTTWGGFAERALARDHVAMSEDGVARVEWDEARVHQVVPPGIAPRAATLFITWRETLSYARRLGVRDSSSVLVIGSGANALAFACHAIRLGGHVVVIGNPRRAALFRSVGVASFIDYRRDSSPGVAGDLDIIIDAVGSSVTIDQFLGDLRIDGVVGIYGLDDRAGSAIHPALARGSFRYYGGGYDEAETHQDVIQLAESGSLDPELWLGSRPPHPLDDIESALRSATGDDVLKSLVTLQPTSTS